MQPQPGWQGPVGQVGQAIQGFAAPIQKIGDIFYAQQQHSDALDLATAENDVHNRLEGLRASIPASTDPQAAVSQFSAGANQILQDTTQKYSGNPRIAPELAMRLGALHQNAVTDVTVQAMKAADTAATNRTRELLPQLANTAATSLDPAAAAHAQKNAEDLISRLPYDQQDATRLSWRNKVTQQQGQYIASNAPGELHGFVAAHPELTPENVTALTTAANQALKAPQDAVEATNAAVRAQAWNGYQQQLSNGTLDKAAVARDVQFGRLTKEDGMKLTGLDLSVITDPATKTSVNARIADANTPEELAQVRADVYQSAANKLINGVDVAKVFEPALAARGKLIGTTQHQQELSSIDQIRRSYDTVPNGAMYDAMVPGRPGALTRAQMKTNAESEFRIKSIGAPPSEYGKIATDAIKNNQPAPGVFKGFDSIPPVTPVIVNDDAGYAFKVWKATRGTMPTPPAPGTPTPTSAISAFGRMFGLGGATSGVVDTTKRVTTGGAGD